jgi:hypothetical protein
MVIGHEESLALLVGLSTITLEFLGTLLGALYRVDLCLMLRATSSTTRSHLRLLTVLCTPTTKFLTTFSSGSLSCFRSKGHCRWLVQLSNPAHPSTPLLSTSKASVMPIRPLDTLTLAEVIQLLYTSAFYEYFEIAYYTYVQFADMRDFAVRDDPLAPVINPHNDHPIGW